MTYAFGSLSHGNELPWDYWSSHDGIRVVDHILTGKAIARAVRAHLIVDAALNALLLYSAALGVPIPQLQHAGMVTLGTLMS